MKTKFTSFTNIVFFYITFRLLVDGMEEFLIQPTAWYYVEYLGQSNFFLGLLLGAYSFSALIIAPFVGAVDVRLKAPKVMLLLCGVIKFIGQLLYTIPVNEYFPLFGRILSGIGEGTIGILYGAIAQATDNQNRARAFLYFEGLYSVGSSFGPIVGSILTFKVDVFGWKINAGNSPGLVLSIIWLFLLILTMFLPRDLTENESKSSESSDSSNTEFDHETESKPTPKEDSTEYSYSRVCCLYFLIFQCIIMLNIGLFYTPLLAVHHFGLNLPEIRLLYANGALFSFVLFLGSYVLSRYMSEKNLIAIGIVSRIIPLLILFYFSIWWNDTRTINNAYILLIFLTSISVAFVIFPFASCLLSKETPVNKASLYQSIAFTVLHAPIVTGRVLAGATFNKAGMMYVAVGLSLAWFLELIWFNIEYRNLFPASERKT